MFGSSSSHVLEAEVRASGVDSFSSNIATAAASLGGLEKAALGAGVGLMALSGAGIAKSIGAAADLDSSLKTSQAIMGDLTKNEMQAMEDKAREIGKTTTFSASEAGEAFYFLASSGYDTEQSLAAVGSVAQFAQAGNLDLADATEYATDAQSALGLASDDAAENQEGLARVMDVLVKAEQSANATTEEFASALTNKAAASMAIAGMELEEGVSILEVFADKGLKGAKAGTILARTIEGLEDAAQTNSAAFEKLGIAVYDADGNMRPMADIIGDMEVAFAGMSTEEKTAAMNMLGLNERAQQGVNLLLGKSDALREYEGDLKNAGGTAEEVANKQLESFNNQLHLLKAAIIDVGIGIGMVLLPYLSSLVGYLTDAVNWFGEINDATDGWLGTLILLGVFVGGAILALGALASMVGVVGMVAGVAAVGVGVLAGAVALLTWPILAVVAALALLAIAYKTNFLGFADAVDWAVGEILSLLDWLVAGFWALVDDIVAAWDWLVAAVMPIVDMLVAELVGYFDWLAVTIGPTVDMLIDGIIAAWDWLVATVGPIVDALVDGIVVAWDWLVATVGAAVLALVDSILAYWDKLKDLATKTLEFLTLIYDTWVEWMGKLMEFLQPFLDEILAAWNEHGAEVLAEVQETFGFLVEWVQAILDLFMLIITTVLDDIKLFWERHGDEVMGIITWAFDAYLAYITWVLDLIWGYIQIVLDGVKTYWDMWGADIMALVTMIFETIKTIVVNTIDLIATIIKVTMALIRGDWEKAWTLIKDFFQRAIDRMVELCSGWVDVMIGFVDTMVTAIIDWFKDLYTKLVGGSIVPDLVNRVVELFTEMKDRVVEFVADLYADVVQYFTDLYNDVVQFVTDMKDGAVDMTVQMKDEMIQAAVDLYDDVTGFFEDLYNDVVDFVTDMKDGAVEMTIQMKDDMVQAAKDLYTDFFDWVETLISDTLSAFDTFGSDLLSWLDGMVKDFIAAVREWGKKALGEVETFIKNILSYLASKVSDFKSAGAALAKAIGDGIKSKAGEAYKKATKMAQGIRDKFGKSDAEEGPLSDITKIGPTFVENIATGMENNLRTLERAATQVAAAAHPNISDIAARATQRALAGTGGARAGGNRIEIHVDARGAENPRRVERSAERGLSRALDAHNVRR